MEHRCGFRRPIDVAVTIRTHSGLVGQGRLCEASASGARLHTSLRLAIHSVVDVVLPFAEQGSSARRPSLQAEVVRPTDAGFGLEWTQFAPQDLKALYEQDARTRSPRKATISNAHPTKASRHHR